MSSSGIDISVIIPIYNVERYIEKCLRSLFTQTKADGVEYILINDATPDRSMEIVNDLIDEFNIQNAKIINNSNNLGSGGSRKKGIEAAIGDYTIFVDSDDWCEPTMLEELYSRAKECDADIVGCDYYIDYGISSKYVSMPMGEDNIECLKMVLSSKLTQSMWSKMVRRELYDHDVNYFIQGLDTWEDLLASVKLFYFAKKVTYLPRAFYHYMQVNTGSITRSGFSQKRLDDIVAAVSDIAVFIDNNNLKLKLEDSFLDRQIYAKFFLLKMAGDHQRQYVSMYPHINKKALRHKGMPIHNRIALAFANHNLLSVFNLIIKGVAKAKNRG